MDVTGKNLLPFPYVDGMTKTTNGITFTVNADRSITCTGTAINQAFFNLSKQRYTANPTDFSKYYSALDCRYDHSNNITHISVSKSDGYVNKTIYPMIVKKGETNLDYEPPRAPPIPHPRHPERPPRCASQQGRQLHGRRRSAVDLRRDRLGAWEVCAENRRTYS